jgi:hypothetical protein
VAVSLDPAVSLEPSGKLRGVLVDGLEPYAATVTTGAVSVPDPPDRPLFDDALYPQEAEYSAVNPNVLRPGGVRVCAGTVHYRDDAPPWCATAATKATVPCAVPYEWGCGDVTIDTHGLFSWVADGHALRVHAAPSAAGYVATASAAIVALILVDTLGPPLAPAWAAREVASITVAVSIMGGFNWAFVIVTAVSFGLAVGGARPKLVAASLRAALVITVAECLTDYNIDATAVSLARVIAAAAVAIAAGARGTVWSLPWAVVRGVLPVVVESVAIDPSRTGDLWLIAVVITGTAFFVGLWVSPAGAWRQTFLPPEPAPPPYVEYYYPAGAGSSGAGSAGGYI